MFADVGRTVRAPGGHRSRALLVLVALGLAASTGLFLKEQFAQRRWTIVEVSLIPPP